MRAYAVRFFLPFRQLILLSYLAVQLSRLRRRPVAQSSLSFQTLPMPGLPPDDGNPEQTSRTGCWMTMEAYVKISLFKAEALDACACEKKYGVVHGREQLRRYVKMRRSYLADADIPELHHTDAEQIPE